MKRRLHCLGLIVIFALVGACAPPAPPTQVPAVTPVRDKLRVFLVNSYAADDFWFQQVQMGLQETLARAGYTSTAGTLEIEILHMEMRQVSLIEEVTPVALQAIEQIAISEPDIVILAGDEATRTVIPLYFDPTLPFVFCGVSSNLSMFGLDLQNVTGVTERLHPVQTVAMAYAFIGDAQRFMVLGDGSVSGRTRALSAYRTLAVSKYGATTPAFRMVREWSQWQDVVLAEGQEVDFILLASYQGVVDADGRLMDEREVITWMYENSPVPVFALSNHAVVNGAVGGLVSYGYEEGDSVAEIVLQLTAGKRPADIPIRGPVRNLLAINLAATRHWNLRIPITFPIAARIYGTQATAQGGQ
jgi:two-component system, sensor histidine kinase and response regulator